MARNKFLADFQDICKRKSNSFATVHVFGEKGRANAMRYSQVENLSNLLQDYFQRTFDSHEVWVGVCVQSKQWLVPILLGLWKSQLAFAAIDPENQNRMIQALNLKYIISDRPILSEHCSAFNIVNTCFYIYKMHLEVPRSFPVDEWDMCYGMCTSGSTGEPKLVQVPWSCIYPNAKELGEIFNITENDVISSIGPYTFDPFFIELFCSITKGAQLLLPGETFSSASAKYGKFDPKFRSLHCELVEVTASNPTVLQVTPSIFKLVFEKDYNTLGGSCSNLRLLIMGGENFPILKKRHSSCQVFNIYGITEISCWSFLYEIPVGECSRVPIGNPLEGIFYKIQDGELLIGHESRKCLMEGEDPEKFPHAVCRKTGDLVEIDPDTGQLYILTRRDNVIKKFGAKVPMGKITSLLECSNILKNFSVVYDATTQAIGLFVVLESHIDVQYEICSVGDVPWLKEIFEKLDDIQKPDLVIQIKYLPITSHGKTDMTTLRDILNKEMRRRPFQEVGKTFEAVWCEILGMKRPHLGKSFIESGGNSILGLKLVARLNLLKISLPETLISHLLDSFNFQDCCSLIVKANQIEHNERNEGILGLDMSPKPGPSACALSLKWSFNLNKCVDAPPKLFSLDG